MIGNHDKKANFFDSYVFDNLLPKEHILLDIIKEIDFSFVNKELKDLYDETNGRPAYPPEVLFKMLFLEFYYNLSDVEVVKECQVNVLYRYFIGLPIDEKIPDDTTLVVFRRRCGHKRFESIFNRIVESCNKKGILKEGLKITDATNIEGDISVPNRVNLLRKGRGIVVKKIRNIDKERGEKLSHYVEEKTSHDKPSREEVTDEISKTEELILEVKGNYGDDVEDIISILEELCSHKDKQETNSQENSSQDMNSQGSDSQGSHDRNTHDSQDKHIVSFSDTDARFGAKSNKKKFVGYKAHVCMDESGIVTAIDVLHGNESESTDLPRLLEKEQLRGICGTGVTADALYDSIKNREFIHGLGLKAYIPPRREERDKAGFMYDSYKDIVACPYGNIARSGKCRQEQGTLYNFNPKICRACLNKCKWFKRDRCRLFVSDDLKLRAYDKDELYDTALNKRKAIERKFGEVKKWHGLRRARYRGKEKVAIQVFMTFLVANIKRMIKLIKEDLEKEFSYDRLLLEKA